MLAWRISETARAAGRIARAIPALAVVAAARKTLGDALGAENTLLDALILGEQGRFVRSIVRVGAAVRDTLVAVQSRLDGGTPLEHAPSSASVPRLLSEREPDLATSSLAPTGGPVPPLTRREFEVLSLIAAGASNQEIARNLVVSTGTIK